MAIKQTAEVANILTDRRAMELPPIAVLVRKASAEAGIGAGKIFREMIALGFRKHGLTQREYLANRLYDTSLSPAEKREFIGEAASFHLNQRLSPPDLTRMRGFLNDKATITSLWQQFGLPTTRTQAVFTPDRWLGHIPTLRTGADIRVFLTTAARFPLFGKPAEGLQGLGSIRIDSVDATAETAALAGGRIVEIDAIIEEIVRVFPEGYLFQDVVGQHPEISERFSQSLSCVRLVTVIPETEPEILYAYWKIASPSAISDNFWQAGSLLAKVDVETGVVESCISGSGPNRIDVSRHPATDAEVLGYRLPFWREARDLVRRAHAMYPINGCLGWDVAFTAEGPLLVECNDNPGHDTYQLVLGRGILNGDFKAVFDRVDARNRRIIAEKKARHYKIEH